jgi:hypothetical protein
MARGQRTRFGVAGILGAGGRGTGVALPSARHNRRSSDTRFKRTVTAAGDMSTFMSFRFPGA